MILIRLPLSIIGFVIAVFYCDIIFIWLTPIIYLIDSEDYNNSNICVFGGSGDGGL